MIEFKPLPALTALALVGIAILIALGKWQLDRLHWKLDLIAAAETRSHADPVPVEDLLRRPADEIEYARAFAQGRFLNDKESYLFAQLEDGRIGYEVITPLKLEDGRILLVDRGFVARELKDPSRRLASQIVGRVRVTGLARAAQKPRLVSAPPDPGTKTWYVRDVGAIAEASGLSGILPFMLAADAAALPGGMPEGGHTRLSFRNDHLDYALTWFALAGVLLVIYLAYHVKRGRLRFRVRG